MCVRVCVCPIIIILNWIHIHAHTIQIKIDALKFIKTQLFSAHLNKFPMEWRFVDILPEALFDVEWLFLLLFSISLLFFFSWSFTVFIFNGWFQLIRIFRLHKQDNRLIMMFWVLNDSPNASNGGYTLTLIPSSSSSYSFCRKMSIKYSIWCASRTRLNFQLKQQCT